ncbi:MAG: hypothetical protein MK212_13990 [Saprospiraceae bacterium]|nr:hypothetical protein [Saprospiraceae bacterium]
MKGKWILESREYLNEKGDRYDERKEDSNTETKLILDVSNSTFWVTKYFLTKEGHWQESDHPRDGKIYIETEYIAKSQDTLFFVQRSNNSPQYIEDSDALDFSEKLALIKEKKSYFIITELDKNKFSFKIHDIGFQKWNFRKVDRSLILEESKIIDRLIPTR